MDDTEQAELEQYGMERSEIILEGAGSTQPMLEQLMQHLQDEENIESIRGLSFAGTEMKV